MSRRLSTIADRLVYINLKHAQTRLFRFLVDLLQIC